MSLLGQATGAWTESSSALRILYVGVRNSVGILTNDSFTQLNPHNVTTQATPQVDTTAIGALSGSVCFARPDFGDTGSNYIGGVGLTAANLALFKRAGASGARSHQGKGFQPLGCFINSAAGNSYENLPAAASGKGPYVSGQGTYGNAVYETKLQGATVGAGAAAGATLTYVAGSPLIASANGYLMPKWHVVGAAVESTDDATASFQGLMENTDNVSTLIGILKMPADTAQQNEIVYDQRI